MFIRKPVGNIWSWKKSNWYNDIILDVEVINNWTKKKKRWKKLILRGEEMELGWGWKEEHFNRNLSLFIVNISVLLDSLITTYGIYYFNFKKNEWSSSIWEDNELLGMCVYLSVSMCICYILVKPSNIANNLFEA